MRPYLFFTLILAHAFPNLAEAGQGFHVGDRVLANGSLHRKCSARVEAVPAPGFARLAFDRAGCGDASTPYDMRRLQSLGFVKRYGGIAEGDAVLVKGHFGNDCAGRVKEISRAGYFSVDLDSFLCADADGLLKARDLRRVRFVGEATLEDSTFTVGEKVTAKGIREGETCRAEIRKLTDNGLAELAFDGQTCAYAGRLYSLEDLEPVKAAAARRHESGDAIFQRVMREIASAKKKSKRLSRAP